MALFKKNGLQTHVTNLYAYESTLWADGFQRIMGLDEVGRGCLAGPVVVSGVILDPSNPLDGVNDSKLLKASKRIELSKIIKESALFWVISSCTNEEIDRTNILRASLKAMKLCVESENGCPDYVLVDGNKEIDTVVQQMTLIGGDRLSASIAAASILAKVERDTIMQRYHKDYPEFGWDKNVGYPTSRHYEALKIYGKTPLHRMSFNLKTDTMYDVKKRL